MMARTAWLLLLLLLFAAFAQAESDDAALAKLITAKKARPLPTEWTFPAARPLRVLNVRGRWYPNYATDRALARLGGAYMTDCWVAPKALRYYPDSVEEVMAHHLVIVGNVDGTAFGAARRVALREYVKAGGAVLFLGGRVAFWNDYHDTAFEEMAPATFPEADDVTRAPDGMALAPGKDIIGSGFAKLPWAERPRLYWYHKGVTAKAGAKVLLTAGGTPLLIAGSYGKGRIAVFTGSVLGDPQVGELPFWAWSGWPTVLAETITWLTEPVRANPATLGAEARQALTVQLLGSSVKKTERVAPAITRTAAICRDAATAQLLVKAVINLEGDIPIELIDLVGDAARPYAGADLLPPVQELYEARRATKASLGLRLLGACHPPGARTQLETALKNPDTGGPQDPTDAGETEQIVEDVELSTYAIRLGALEGLGNLGDPAALPLLKSSLRDFAKRRSVPDLFPNELTHADELYQEAVFSALRCGDASAAAPAVDLLLENRYLFIRMMSVIDAPQYPGPEHEAMRRLKIRVARDLPHVHARLDRIYRKLTQLPEGVLPALAARIAEEDDPRVAPIAFAIFGHGFTSTSRKLAPAVKATLRKARIPAVADLAGE